MSFDRSGLESYNTVAERIAEFRAKYPEGSLQPVNPAKPFDIVEVAGKTYVVYAAAAYRTPDDPRPGIGVAWEPFPGRTPYTRDSEIMVGETSAWGRAIVAVGAADTRKGIATREEVQNRHDDQAEWDAAKPATAGQARVYEDLLKQLNEATSIEQIKTDIGKSVHIGRSSGAISAIHYDRLDRRAGERIAELQQAEES